MSNQEIQASIGDFKSLVIKGKKKTRMTTSENSTIKEESEVFSLFGFIPLTKAQDYLQAV